MQLDLPQDWPSNLKALVRLAVEHEDTEGWTADRVRDTVEAITALLKAPHHSRLLADLARQPRSLASLDGPSFLPRLLEDLDRRVLERWRELELVRQRAPVEPEHMKAERVALEPHAARVAPNEVRELAGAPTKLKADITGSTAAAPAAPDEAVQASAIADAAKGAASVLGAPPAAAAVPTANEARELRDHAPEAVNDNPPTGAKPQRAELPRPARPPRDVPPTTWSEVTLTARDPKEIGVSVRGVEWGAMSMPRDGRGAERSKKIWETLLLFLRFRALWWDRRPAMESGVVVARDADEVDRELPRIRKGAWEKHISNLRLALQQAFEVEEDLLKPEWDDLVGREVRKAPFQRRWLIAPDDYFPDDALKDA